MGMFLQVVHVLTDLLRVIVWPGTVVLLVILAHRWGLVGERLFERLVERLKEVRSGPVQLKFAGLNRLRSPRGLPDRPATEQPRLPEPADVMRARAFVLQNESGAARAIMWVTDDDTPSLMLFDPHGKRRLSLDVVAQPGGEYLPVLSLQDRDGDSRVHLEIDSHGRPQLGLFGSSGDGMIGLGLGDDGNPQFGLWDGADKLRVIMRTLVDGDAGLAIADGAERVRSAFLVSRAGTPDLVRYPDDSSG